MAIDISTTYMGLTLPTPIIAGSSGMTDDLYNLKKLEDAGVGAVVLKSLFEEEILAEVARDQQAMHRPGSFFPETAEMEDFLDDETGMADYLQLIADGKKSLDIPVIASVNCITAKTWPAYAGMIQEAGADGIELNIFLMPSEMSVDDPKELERRYFEIIEAVRSEVSLPVSVKVSYHFTLLASSLRALSETGIAGLVLFNRFFNPDFDIETFKVIPTNVLSTPELLHLSLRWVAIMSGRVGCDIAASTGVHSGDAVVKQLLAGATVVQVASALYRDGIGTVTPMVERLTRWMEDHDYSSLADFRGRLSQKSVDDPGIYDRVQFIRNYRGFAGGV